MSSEEKEERVQAVKRRRKCPVNENEYKERERAIFVATITTLFFFFFSFWVLLFKLWREKQKVLLFYF